MTIDLQTPAVPALPRPRAGTTVQRHRAAPGDQDEHGRILAFSDGDDMGVWLTAEELRRAVRQHSAPILVPAADTEVLP